MSDTLFIRLLADDDKETALTSVIASLQDPAPVDSKIYTVNPNSFHQVPGSPFAYWVSDRIRQLFTELPAFESEGRTVRVGLQTSDDFRFIRLWWEVEPEKIVTGTTETTPEEFCKQTFEGKRWVPFAKGGEYSPYYSDLHLVVNWERDGEEVRNFKKKVKASKRWKKASKKVAKLQRQVANQRQEWAHKVAAQIVSGNSMVATEKLNIKGMTRKARKGSKRKRQKSGLNRSILDTGWGLLRGMIEYKLAECDGVFVEVPTVKVKPSQTCPNCGYQELKTLDQREHHCAKCGYTDDRDVAAAKVMLSWALGTSVLNRGEGSSTSVPKERKNCGGMKQLASLKRQKLQAQPLGGLE